MLVTGRHQFQTRAASSNNLRHLKLRLGSGSKGRARVLLLPASNGAVPGEIDRFAPRADIAANQAIGLPWFDVVWAMPSNILHSNKQVAKILFVGDRRLLHSLQPRKRVVIRGERRRGEAVAQCNRCQVLGDVTWSVRLACSSVC